MYNKGWKTNWSENRKYITFINNEGKKQVSTGQLAPSIASVQQKRKDKITATT